MAPRISVELDANGDFVFMDRRHNDKMLEGLNRLRLNNTFCDVILCCGGKEFPCHRNVLVSFSCYFEAMFTIEWMESRQMRVAIHGVEPQGLEMLVGYAYSSKVVISAANVQALLTAANLLNVMAVQEACCHYMEHRMDETNCVGIHCLAEAHSCKTLAQRSMEYILTHFSAVFRQEEFLSLSVEKVTQILSSENLDVPKEEMVVEAAMLWLNKCPTHRHTFEKVLEQIRLPLISPSYLHDVIESLDVVKESQGCQRLIAETKDPNLMQYSCRARPRECRVREVMLVVHEDEEKSCYAEIFDPRINRWKSLLADLLLPVRAYSVVVSGSSLYMAGGNSSHGSTSTEMWRYDLRDPTQEPCDLSRGSWLQMASMDVARSGFGLVMLDGYMYAVGGCSRVLDLTSGVWYYPVFVERYDPDMNTWQPMRSVNRSEYHISPCDVIALDGLIYLVGTFTSPTDGVLLSRVKKYDPETSIWTDCAPMQFPRTHFARCTLKGNIYVIGGKCPTELTSNTYTDKVECYNPQTNQWRMCAPMKRRRFMPRVAVVDGNIYVLKGSKRFATPVRDIEQYNDERDTWRIVGEVPTNLFICDESMRCFSLRLADVYAQAGLPKRDMARRSSVDANGDFVFMDMRYNNKMLEGLNRLRLNNTFCDVILCCGGKEFPCHRNVLVSFSCYFEAMFTVEWMESRQMRVAIHGVEAQGLEMLVGYAYSSKVVISVANVQTLLTAANLLNVMAVQEACCHYMVHCMDETNCVGIHCLAEAHSCKTLAKRSMEYILTHFSAVFRQEEFLSLSVEKVTQILSSENLDVPKEEMVVEAALLWLNKCPTHRHTFEKVLEQIRLPLISPSYRHDVIESLDVVKESQGCQRLIAETKDPNLMQYSRRARPRECRVRNVMLVVHERNKRCYAEIFDPRINRWKSLLADMPLPVSGHSLVGLVSGSSLYMAGRNSSYGSTSTEMWRYDLRDPTQEPCDLSRGQWLQMASMDVARSGFGLVMLDGYMYAVGGCSRVLDLTSRVWYYPVFVERYDPDMNTWQPMRSVNRSEYRISPRDVIALDGLIYLVGTVTVPTDDRRQSPTDGELLSRVKKYDPETSIWTDCAPVQFPRTHFARCTLKGNIYVIGGDCPTELSSNTYTDKVECYNPQTNQWRMCAPMKRKRWNPVVAVVDGYIHVLGGSESFGTGLRDIERYNDERDTWRIVAEIPTKYCIFKSLRCFSLRLADVYAQTPSSS